MDRHVIVENFWSEGFEGDKTLAIEDLGWSDSMKRNAQSDNPEQIFRYVVDQLGLNVLFYWVEDRSFYTIETEKIPVEVRRIYDNPNWDGKTELLKAGIYGSPSTCSPGEIVATFNEPSEIWDNLKIGSRPIGEVLANSMIIELD